MSLFETKRYVVTVSDSTDVEDRYLCTNKQTGVVEFRDHLLPRVIDTLLHLETNLAVSEGKLREHLSGDLAPLALVVMESTDGSSNIH
jgi:hypothetical protein